MANYELKLKTKDAGTQKARTVTITNVNPEASSTILKQFTQKLNNLTTNTYEQTDYVVTTNLDTEVIPEPDTRATATFSLTNESFTTNLTTYLNNGSNSSRATEFTTNSDGVISVAIDGTTTNLQAGIGVISGATKIQVSKLQSGTVSAGSFTVRITGTTIYKPFEQIFNFT